MITGVYIGTERLELFEDEEIRIKSNVAKIEDITKIFTDTSNDFTVPASDVNNAIFNHWYESDVINGFDARKKAPAVIEMFGVNYKVGKIRLKKVNFKHNQPDNYSIEFFGNLVDIKDKVKDDKLVDLDLSDLNFEYNSNNVKNKLTTTSDLCFSLLSSRRLLYDSDNGVLDNDKQTNVYYDGNNNATGLKSSDILASVKQLKIIEAIESKYDFQFSRDFLGGYDFSSQYLALSGTDDLTGYQIPLTDVEYSDPTVSGNTMMVDGLGSESERQTDKIQISILLLDDYKDVPYNCYIKNGDKIIAKKENVTNNLDGDNSLIVKTTSVAGGFKDVTFWIESSFKLIFNAKVQRIPLNPILRNYFYYPKNLNPTINFNVANRLPDIKVIDYLKGIFKMSKLVAVPQKDGTIYLDNLTSFYRKGKVYDLTDNIDYNSHTVSEGTILNEINYNFEEPQTILAQQFVKNNGIAYGDLELRIEDDNGDLIDGDSLGFKLPFENIVYEKIQDLADSNVNTFMQYGLLQDENLDSVTIKPHIHYIETFKAFVGSLGLPTLKYINDNQTASELVSFNCPLHITDTSLQTFSTTFDNEFNEYDGNLISNTIYSNYHQPFIESVFNVQKREYNFKAKDVPLSIVLNLNLNDVIEIKGKFFRIDSFETSTSNNDIDFKLINDRNVDLTPLVSIKASNTDITVDSTIITVDSI